MALFEWNNDYYEEEKRKAEEDDEKALSYYNDGMYYYNMGHYSDAKWRFQEALSLAHDRDLINDCREMIDECGKGLHDVYML